MEELETGKDKIKQICDLLKRETLEPAKDEAKKIVDEAKEEAEKIIANAQKEGEALIHKAREEIERERNVFLSSLTQASKQSIEALKIAIEQQLFDKELQRVMSAQMSDPQIIAKLLNALVKVIERDGVSANFSAIIPSEISVSDVNRFLLEGAQEKLKEGILLEDFTGGVKLKLRDKNMTIDLTAQAVVELLEKYLRKDFRKWLFGGQEQ